MKINATITVVVDGREYTETVGSEDNLMHYLRRAVRNGKNPALAISELAELGTRDTAHPVTMKNAVGE